MYPLTWGKNGSFCRNEFQKIIFFGKKSVIFQIKNEQQKYFILIKKDVCRETDGDSRSLGVFCSLCQCCCFHYCKFILMPVIIPSVSICKGYIYFWIYGAQDLKRAVMSNEIALCFTGEIDL